MLIRYSSDPGSMQLSPVMPALLSKSAALVYSSLASATAVFGPPCCMRCALQEAERSVVLVEALLVEALHRNRTSVQNTASAARYTQSVALDTALTAACVRCRGHRQERGRPQPRGQDMSVRYHRI